MGRVWGLGCVWMDANRERSTYRNNPPPTHLGREALDGDEGALVVDVRGEVVHARDLQQALGGGLFVEEDLFRVVCLGCWFVGWMVYAYLCVFRPLSR